MSNSSRRDFLKVAAIAPAASYGRILGANDRIRLGQIGCGGMGSGDLATFLLYDDVECVVCCDVDDEMIGKTLKRNAARLAKQPDVVKDFRRVIERKDVDALIVSTPDHWHALPTIYGFEAGKDVYVQKPLAVTIGEGRAMLEAAKRYKRVAQMGTQWRFGPHYKEAVEFVQSGKLGKIRQVRAWAYLDWVGGIGNPPDGDPPAGVDYNMWLGPAPKRPFNKNRYHFNWRWFWDYGNGLMSDWGVHLINIGMWAMGYNPPKTITSTGGKMVVDDNTETPDTQTAVYEFPTYTFIWEHQMLGGVGIGGRPHGLSFSGGEGTLIVDASGFEVIPEPKKKSLVAYKRMRDPNDRGAEGRPALVRNFLDCMRSRQQPGENLEVGHFVSSVAHLGNVALRTGAKVVWDAASERAVGLPEADAYIHRKYREPWKLSGTKS
ncbi:MAG: Gfo/Idh/MocA family oxidoreductase [Acidobacteriales bacterium]|nr:Gfo/Idh/MocA family oxidoreductase [Terriglobales bacterium]